MKVSVVALYGFVLLPPVTATSVHAQTSSDADFSARCNAPGVVACYGFNNTSTDIVRGVNLFPDGMGVYRAVLDTSVKASGAGSLRFDMPPPPHAGANVGGSWVPAGGWGRTFSENSTFYVQYRLRLSPYMLRSDAYGRSIWKTTIFHSGVKTCASIELTTSNYYGTPIPQLDTDCGGKWMWTTLDGGTHTMAPPLLLQQTETMQCAYGVDYLRNCETYVADEWMTLYYRVQIGTWDQPNSSLDAWIGREGSSTLKPFVKVRNFVLSCNGTPCTTSPNKDDGYNTVTITPYMTGLATNLGPSSTEYMWFDEFIVSTQPIAGPNGQVSPTPRPPSNLQVN